MNKRTTMALVEGIRTQLFSKCPNVFYMESTEKKQYPMIVFEVRPSYETRMTLELDLWEMRGSEKALFDLADTVEEFMDGMVLSEPEYIASFYTNNDMKNVPDENKDFRHVNMSFNIIYQS